MSYIVIEIQKNANGQVGNIVTAYEDKAAAENKYHTILAAAAISSIPIHSAVMVNEQGFPLHFESYKHEVQVEPEPESN